MKKLLLILFFIPLTVICLAKSPLTGTYWIKGFDHQRISCFLYLTDNGLYYLEFSENVLIDYIVTSFISFGSFELSQDNKIILKDEVYGFKIECILFNTNKIIVKKGFGFLESQTFSLAWDDFTDYRNRLPALTLLQQKEERIEYKKTHKKIYPFECGIYENKKNRETDLRGYIKKGFSYELKINKDKKYQLYYKGILFSEGNWKKDGNEIALYDIHLKHTFYVFVTENGLVSKYLPVDYRGEELYKVKEEIE